VAGTAVLVREPLCGRARELAPLLRVRSLFASYGQAEVLRGVDFDVWPGQLVALCGENGAGKSTLVRCIAGDLVPDAGDVTIGGVRVRTRAGATASGLAVVWQGSALCDNLDVAANLFLGQERRRWVSEWRDKLAAQAVLDSYGIKVASGQAVASLSAGQRQLVAIARAMQLAPRLLVLDEPAGSLGVQETRQVEELIKKLSSTGTTVLLVSHDVDQVFRLAARILVLHRGRVVADLVPAETHPEDLVALMSGHAPDATARRQLARLQSLVDELASAGPASSLPLIASALATALSVEAVCIHLIEDRTLRLVAATGLPSQLAASWASLPIGQGGGPMGAAAASGHIVVDEDIERSRSWAPFLGPARAFGARSSWAVPLIGSGGLIGVITGCQSVAGPPGRDQMDLVALYAGYAAGAIERDRLFAEVTARNRVLETIREVLETLAGPEPAALGLLKALRSLQRGLKAAEVELWLAGTAPEGEARCAAFVDQAGRAWPWPAGRDPGDATAAFSHLGGTVTGLGARSLATCFPVPAGQAVLLARWEAQEPPEDAPALLSDGAHSVRLALERDEAEQAHEQAAALRRSHQLQRDFLSRLSHELRTPLTAIRGYATSLLAPDVTWDYESRQRFLSRIATESARLGRLVGDLLDFSAIESGLLRLQPDWCDLPLVLEAAVSCLPPERSRAISLAYPDDLGPIWADHDRLEQVFVNLLDNALRHNPCGVNVEVRVSSPVEGTVQVRVADDGAGLPADLRRQLAGSGPGDGGTLASSAVGSGLGLSIARGIVLAHGGRLELEDVPQGTCFLVALPVDPPPDERGEAAE
jgi:signal transduction histidine kinase/ABC-type multidrug transport system ATPase subunit